MGKARYVASHSAAKRTELGMAMNSLQRRSYRMRRRLGGNSGPFPSIETRDIACLREQYQCVDTFPRCHILLQLVIV